MWVLVSNTIPPIHSIITYQSGNGYDNKQPYWCSPPLPCRKKIADALNGGEACANFHLTDQTDCNTASCPKGWLTRSYIGFKSNSVDCDVGEWGAWTTCSATCGGGRKKRTRQGKIVFSTVIYISDKYLTRPRTGARCAQVPESSKKECLELAESSTLKKPALATRGLVCLVMNNLFSEKIKVWEI